MARARKSEGKGRRRKGTGPSDPAQPESLGVDRSDREAGKPVQLGGEQAPAGGGAPRPGGASENTAPGDEQQIA